LVTRFGASSAGRDDLHREQDVCGVQPGWVALGDPGRDHHDIRDSDGCRVDGVDDHFDVGQCSQYVGELTIEFGSHAHHHSLM
jgi:hypothetical protein